jgi:hypothetical protein
VCHGEPFKRKKINKQWWGVCGWGWGWGNSSSKAFDISFADRPKAKTGRCRRERESFYTERQKISCKRNLEFSKDRNVKGDEAGRSRQKDGGSQEGTEMTLDMKALLTLAERQREEIRKESKEEQD